MAIKTYPKGSKEKVSKNFYAYEFDCHGHGCCAETIVDEKLVEYLQKIRDHFGKPIDISSPYRCTVHNKRIGGATGSYHAEGMAADFVVRGVAPREVAKYAESIGVKGIGLYESSKDGYFVHIDTRDVKAFWYGQAQLPRSTFGGISDNAVATDDIYKIGKTYTLQVGLAVRAGAGTGFARKLYSQLTLGAKKNANSAGYLNKGTRVTCLEVKKVGNDLWMRIPSGWCAAYYNGKYYIK